MVSVIALSAMVPVLLLLVVLATDVWAYRDSGLRLAEGEPVTVTVGPYRMESPTVWFVACLLGHQRIGRESGLHRFRQSISFAVINRAVTRQSCAWRWLVRRSVLRRSWP